MFLIGTFIFKYSKIIKKLKEKPFVFFLKKFKKIFNMHINFLFYYSLVLNIYIYKKDSIFNNLYIHY